MDLPAEQPMTLHQVNNCVSQAVRQYPQIHPLLVKTLLATEGGQIGTIRRNTDKSYDLGPMQINTIHLPDINKRHGYSGRDLVIDGCKNIMAGTGILADRLRETKGNIWLAMGNYHSKTPSKRGVYLKKIAESYVRLLEGRRNGEEAKAIGRTTNWGRGASATGFPSLSALETAIGLPLAKKVLPPNPTRKSPPQNRVIAIDNANSNLRFTE